MSRLPLPVALLLACALIVAACGGGDKEKEASAPPAATPTDAPEAAQDAGCEKVAKPAPHKAAKLPKPEAELEKGKTYVARVLTNCGEFEITLDAKQAPRTGGSFKYLVDKRFYDGLTFHRIVPGFVIQGGDPQGNGTGGPGYSVVEEPPSDLTYDVGVVAMAKTGAEPPGTSGSQFFVVTGAQASQLGPEYALVGKVTKGQDVVDKIGAVPTDEQSQAPIDPVVIQQVKIETS
jgi:peptidyl-prolyl cis-trans isomerase B (cyclophilin B)